MSLVSVTVLLPPVVLSVAVRLVLGPVDKGVLLLHVVAPFARGHKATSLK